LAKEVIDSGPDWFPPICILLQATAVGAATVTATAGGFQKTFPMPVTP
jgi:hypothetical protein